MKLQSGLLALFFTTVVSTQVQAPLHSADSNIDFKVPGNNPLYFGHDPKDYVLQLHELDLDPNPPVPGQKLNILSTGHLTEVADQGSFAHVEVKMAYLGITLLKENFDLCYNAEKAVGEQCPFRKGFWNISKEVELPKQIPPGKYSVAMQAYTDEVMTEYISSMHGDVTFKAQ